MSADSRSHRSARRNLRLDSRSVLRPADSTIEPQIPQAIGLTPSAALALNLDTQPIAPQAPHGLLLDERWLSRLRRAATR